MKNKSALLLLTLILPCLSASAAVYIEPRVSHLTITGTPDIGDIGRETGSDLPSVTVGLAIGYELSGRASLELRYTHLGDLTISKVSPYATVFPLKPGDSTALVISNYEFEQRTDLISAALPLQIWTNGKLSLHFTPIFQVELTEVELYRVPLPNGTVPVLDVRRSNTVAHPAAEIALGYRLSDRASARLQYTYSPLGDFDAHLWGTGLQVKF